MKPTKEEMLETLEVLCQTSGLDFLSAETQRRVQAIRDLIEKVGEWQESLRIMLEIGPPEYNADDIFNKAKEICDFGKEGE